MPAVDHRPPCDGSCSTSSPWTCGVCKRLCAPCWGGGYDDELGDLCDPCLALLGTVYKVVEVAAVARELAAVIAAREHPGWAVVAARESSEKLRVFFITLVREEEVLAAQGAREECRLHGHRPGYLGHERFLRCLRCGIRLKASERDLSTE